MLLVSSKFHFNSKCTIHSTNIEKLHFIETEISRICSTLLHFAIPTFY